MNKNIIKESRKYFDYELAYEMYVKVKELFNKGGIDLILEQFDIDYNTQDNGYIVVKDELNSYNAEVYLIDNNFDTNEKSQWYVSGEVDMYSYCGGDDNLYINNIRDIQNRLEGLYKYSKDNEYSTEDFKMEKESFKKVLKEIENEN